MIAKTIPTIFFFILCILVNQKICDKYEPKYLYSYDNTFDTVLSFAFGINFIDRYFK